jgi:adenine phosphoribosyltransferase
MDLRALIRDIPDFPQPGILFRDITPALSNAAAFAAILDAISAAARAARAEAIVGIESRGFVFGAPVADRLRLPFVPVRKPGKLPPARLSVAYALEYGESQLDIHADAFSAARTRAFVIDDVLATGGTALATAKLVELAGGEVAGFGFVIVLEVLGGRGRLTQYPVSHVLSYA